MLGQAGGGEKFYDYVYAYNGFAAKLSAGQAEKLERLSGVKSVEPILQWALRHVGHARLPEHRRLG